MCDAEVAEFKCRFRLCFSPITDSPWNNYVARCILILWELCMIHTYHQPRFDSKGMPTPLLKLTQFRMTGKQFKHWRKQKLSNYFSCYCDSVFASIHGSRDRFKLSRLSCQGWIRSFVATNQCSPVNILLNPLLPPKLQSDVQKSDGWTWSNERSRLLR